MAEEEAWWPAWRLWTSNDEDKCTELREIHAKSRPEQSGQPKRTKKNKADGFWVPPWLAEFCWTCALSRNSHTLGTTDFCLTQTSFSCVWP